MKSRKINWKILLSCIVIVFAVAFVGSLFTSSNINSEWYDSIKPSIIPPNFVFPVVWNILFFLIALSLYFVYMNSKKQDKKKIIIVFAINLILNILWSALFFGLQVPLFAFYELILLWLSICLMIYVTYRINKLSSYLLIPYLLWVSFAGYLNWLIVF